MPRKTTVAAVPGRSGTRGTTLEVVQAPARGAEKTLVEGAYERSKSDIYEFRMAPGQRYSEQELARRLGISRTPLRFALHLLAREGFLVRLEGHASWQVRPFENCTITRTSTTSGCRSNS